MFTYTAEFGMVYLYYMPFVRKDVDNLDIPNFAYHKSFPTVAINPRPARGGGGQRAPLWVFANSS